MYNILPEVIVKCNEVSSSISVECPQSETIEFKSLDVLTIGKYQIVYSNAVL